MGKLLSYSGTTTKIRAIKSRLLTRKDYETLAAMPTVTGALAYLKQKPSYEELFSGRMRALCTGARWSRFSPILFMRISRRSTVFPPYSREPLWISILAGTRSPS